MFCSWKSFKAPSICSIFAACSFSWPFNFMTLALRDLKLHQKKNLCETRFEKGKATCESSDAQEWAMCNLKFMPLVSIALLRRCIQLLDLFFEKLAKINSAVIKLQVRVKSRQCRQAKNVLNVTITPCFSLHWTFFHTF